MRHNCIYSICNKSRIYTVLNPWTVFLSTSSFCSAVSLVEKWGEGVGRQIVSLNSFSEDVDCYDLKEMQCEVQMFHVGMQWYNFHTIYIE